MRKLNPGPLTALAALLLAALVMPAPLAQESPAEAEAKEQAKKARVVGTAQGAAKEQKPAPAKPQGAEKEQKPAPAKPQGSDRPIPTSDPDHVSAVKALEQIRREEEMSAEGSFSYRPGNRRDPFLSPHDILQAEITGRVCEGEGMECWLIQDVVVIGVLARKSGNVALVIGPDGYGTTLREGDRLYDGEVRRIDPDTGHVVFRQKVNDPTRIKPFRDIEKGLDLDKEGRS
jgi:hypothetical protein